MQEKTFQNRLIMAILGACIMVNLFFCYSRTSVVSTIYEVFFRDNQYPIRHLVAVDKLFAKFEKGNILVRFEGFDPEGDSGKKLVPLIFFRSVFDYYPGKILVGDPELIIKKGNEFLDTPFTPDDEWLERNKINYQVTFICNEEGGVGLDVQEISKDFPQIAAHGLLPVIIRIVYFLLAGMLVLLFAFLFRRTGSGADEEGNNSRLDAFSIFSIVTIVAMFLIVCAHSVLMPLYEWDSFAIWGLKAKVLFYEGLGSDYFQNPNLAYSHLDYPLLVPFLMSAGTFSSAGYSGEMTSKIIFPFLYLGFVYLIYSAMRWRFSRNMSLLLTAVFASTPALVRWSGAGTADMALAFFYAGSVFYLIKFLEERKILGLIVSAVFSLLCALTKNEGLPLAVINIVILMIFLPSPRLGFKGFRSFLIYIAIFAVLFLPWFMFSHNIPKIHENYIGQLTVAKVAENLDRLKLILPEMLLQFFSIKSWGLVWILVFFASVAGLGIARTRSSMALWLLFAGHFLLYMLTYIIYPYDNLPDLIDQTIDRLYLHILPAGMLFMVLLKTEKQEIIETISFEEPELIPEIIPNPAYATAEAMVIELPEAKPTSPIKKTHRTLGKKTPKPDKSEKLKKPEARPSKPSPRKAPKKRKETKA